MPVIDCQVHAYERNHAGRPWLNTPNWPPEVTHDQMVQAMDKVGVDGAILVSAFSLYGFDASYAIECQKKHPGKFGLVKPVDPNDPAVEETIDEWVKLAGVVGIRIMLDRLPDVRADNPGVGVVMRAAARHGVPINMLCWGKVDDAIGIANAFPGTRLVIDHMAIKQPYTPPAPPEPWKDLPKVLELAACPNVVIKVSGACTLAHEPYPYPDIWDPLARIFDAFGFERCLWGTDWTRAFAVVNYENAVEPFRLTDRLSESEREMLMGGACAKTYNWSPS